VVVLLIALAAGLVPRTRAQRAAAEETLEAGRQAPRVELVTPKVLTGDRLLTLPGSIEALEQTVITPRSQGYVHRWLVDIGDKVKAGQLLAEIDTPEIDAQLEQARAQAAQAAADVLRAQASARFSKTTLDRLTRLTPTGVSSQSDLEKQEAQASVDEANVAVAQATVTAQQANVRRLEQLKAFSRVTAPFEGTIVARMAERGALVNAATTPLFRLAAVDTVRVMVQVPEEVAAGVRVGVPAKVSVREYPGEQFDGVVARSAGALDDRSRTMSTEVRVPNAEGRLLTGMYAQVELTLTTPHRLYEIPVTALYSDAHGTRVATVDANHRVTMRPVLIERDTGQTLLVSTGLSPGDQLVKLANAELGDGSEVELIPPPPPPPPAK
jgi:RND family efflux transporter MFP subunit